MKKIYDTLGLNIKKEPKSDIINLPEGKKFIKYHRYRFDFNFNYIKTSLLNLMCLKTAISTDSKSTDIEKKDPLSYDGYIYPLTDTGSYLDEISTYLAKYETRKKPSKKDDPNYQWWTIIHEENPEKLFHLINKIIYENIEKCVDALYIRFEGNTEISNLTECIKQYIKLNDNYNNTEILIPDLMVEEIKKSINSFNSHNMWNQIKLQNKTLYNKLENNDTNTSSDLSYMGFDD